jgi:hypothetical protein
MFGPKRKEVAGGWRRLHNEELCNLYASPNIITVIKSRMTWAGHVPTIGDIRNAFNILAGEHEGKGHFEDPGIDGRIIQSAPETLKGF